MTERTEHELQNDIFDKALQIMDLKAAIVLRNALLGVSLACNFVLLVLIYLTGW